MSEEEEASNLHFSELEQNAKQFSSSFHHGQRARIISMGNTPARNVLLLPSLCGECTAEEND